MKTITIPIPDDLAGFIEERVNSGRFASASDYIESLLRVDRGEREPLWVEEALLEGLESGPSVPFTDAMWESRKKALTDESQRHRGEVA